MLDHKERVKRLNNVEFGAAVGGAICYWMIRDQRLHDNWAFEYAQQLATKYGVPVAVVFVLQSFNNGTRRAYDFLLAGLEEVASECRKQNVPFFVLSGNPVELLPIFTEQARVSAVVTDFSPLKGGRQWRTELSPLLPLPFFEVDAHNIVPVWTTSDHAEFAARTIRPKITRLLPQFLTEFPKGVKQDEEMVEEWVKELGSMDRELEWKDESVDWKKLRAGLKVDETVKKVDWTRVGEAAAHTALQEFIDHRLADYDTLRNDPTKDGQSNLSPYLHFGQLSAQRVALEVNKAVTADKKLSAAADAFLEELIIRRELSDNFCLYTPDYDTPAAWPKWAAKTLDDHRHDPREHLYTLELLETAATADPAWNAAQREMVQSGKMHGYMRMYWAKKILEWTRSPEEALDIAIYLNDKYSLDGRDPNGYVGIQWSIAGVHDRAWFEREVFGKIRYMNYNGLKRKFAVEEYIK